MNVALFIPTHNRPHCLARILTWLRNSKLSIYVGDSSTINNRPLIESLDTGSLKIKYYYKKDWNIYDKWHYVTSKISEKYTVPCAEDDFPIWQNYHIFYKLAERYNIGCIVGRELSANQYENHIVFEESQEYRKYCIHNTDNQLLDFQKAHNPIVCTFYQFFKTELLNAVHLHWASLKQFYPGNKMQEIIFRSSTFIQDKVIYENTILNVRTNEPTLRYKETSVAARKFRLNFWDEVKVLSEANQVNLFLERHSQLILDSSRWNVSKQEAFDIVKHIIWRPMLSRMNTKHEILWKSRVRVCVSSKLLEPRILPDSESLVWRLPLEDNVTNSYLKEPIEFMNLESFILRRSIDKKICMSIAKILLA